MSRKALLDDIRSELKNLAAKAPALRTRASVPKLYEIFILMCLVKALRKIGATFEIRDSKDIPSGKLVFRLGPGVIYSPTTTSSFVLVTYKSAQYEIQNSLYVLGQSKVSHELDVCLIEREDAQYSRSNGIDPMHTRIKFMAECKYYGDRLDLHLGREFLGLSREFTLRVKTIVSNVESNDIHKIMKQYKGTENFNVSPDNPDAVDRLIQWLANELRHVLA